MKNIKRFSKAFLAGLALLVLVGGLNGNASPQETAHKDQDRDHHSPASKEGDRNDHHHDGDHASASHEDDHDQDSEENSSVGPDKGITEYSPKEGFKISKEGYKNFEIQTRVLKGEKNWPIPPRAVLYSGDEVNVFRLRQGFFKRVDFIILSKTPTELTIKSSELNEGDEIVVQGQAFLRSVEIVATGGAPHGHSH